MVKPSSRFKRGAFSSEKGSRSSRNPKLDRRKPNAVAGYAKRQERKAKDFGANDVYEYTAHSNKRSKIGLSLGKDEREGLERDEDDEDDRNDALEKIRQRIGAEDEDGVVNSEDDEEIESDDAFEGDSDEERFQSFKFVEKVCVSLLMLAFFLFFSSANVSYLTPSSVVAEKAQEA